MTSTVPDADLHDAGRIFADSAAYGDPESWHATAKVLRERAPISFVETPGYAPFWAITKHADVMEIERHPEVFTNAPTPVLTPAAELAQGADAGLKTLIQMDGDEHKQHRSIVNDWFKPANVKKMSDRVDELAEQFVDRMLAMDGRCDFVNDIAVHYPLQVILSILGLPEDDHARMLKLTQELFGAEDPDIGRAGEDASVFEVIMDFVSYFNQLATDRREQPTSDLASVIANAELGGAPLPDMDVFGFYLIIATAGHDTTSNSIAGGLLALLEHRDQLALLQDDPSLIDHAADELIRYVSPVKHFMRTCQEPFTLRDTTFQPGDLTLLSYASANRDDEIFPDPFALDVHRANAASHLAFGFGRHFCLGAHLARMEVKAIFRHLLPRLASIDLDGPVTHVQARLVSGPKVMPIRYTWR